MKMKNEAAKEKGEEDIRCAQTASNPSVILKKNT
jgi:hypothetical protein